MAIKDTTREMLEMLPPWLAMQDEESTGAKFLDVIGSQIEDIQDIIDAILSRAIIVPGDDSITILDIDYLYKLVPHKGAIDENRLSVRGYRGNIEFFLDKVDNIYRFYAGDDEAYYYDADENTLYFKSHFDSLMVNDALYEGSLELHHVWNPFDEAGLLLGCPRLYGERNDSYRDRLVDVFANKGNSSRSGLINYISRSLGINEEKVIIDSLDNREFIDSLMNHDGSMKPELMEYIRASKSVNGFGANSYWDALDESKAGLHYLPMIWDIGLVNWDSSKIQNGIGDTDDLLVIQPEQEEFEQSFTYNVYAEGLHYPDRKIYPEHRFKYKVYAVGKKYDDGYSPEVYKYTITASDLMLLAFDIVAKSSYQHEYLIDYSYVNIYPKETIEHVAGVDIAENSHRYVTKNTKLVDGTYCTNTPRRYLQIIATMESDETKRLTPELNSVTLHYSVGGVDKSIVFQGEDIVTRIDPNNHIVGFESHTWNDASPYVKVRNDTNDSYNTVVDTSGILQLTYGEYQKVYNSKGDWTDGMSNPGTSNVTIDLINGNLKLDNTRVL